MSDTTQRSMIERVTEQANDKQVVDQPKPTVWETIETEGSRLVDEVRELVREGNVSRIVVRQDERVIAEFPLTVGVVGALLAPALAALGALAALLGDCTIDIEREETAPASEPEAVDQAVDQPAAAPVAA
jgi:hypothetical protein